MVLNLKVLIKIKYDISLIAIPDVVYTGFKKLRVFFSDVCVQPMCTYISGEDGRRVGEERRGAQQQPGVELASGALLHPHPSAFAVWSLGSVLRGAVADQSTA